jgi:hypothetical protein
VNSLYLLPKAASYSWRCVIAHLNFPPTVLSVLYTEAYLDFVSFKFLSAVVTSNYDVAVGCSKEFTLEHYHTPGVYDSKSMTAEHFVQWSANDVPRMAFKFRSAALRFVAYKQLKHEARSEAKTFLCKYWLYHIQVLWEREILFRGMSICSIFFFYKLNSQRISTVIWDESQHVLFGTSYYVQQYRIL